MTLDPRLVQLTARIRARRAADPADSYVASLFAKGRPAIAQKLGEEAVETIIAAISGDARATTAEAADLLFHLGVLLDALDLDWNAVLDELARRDGVGGHAEKAARKQETPHGG